MGCTYWEGKTKGLSGQAKALIGIAINNTFLCPVCRETHTIKEVTTHVND
ncbi:hypothetical protein L3i20_v212320 [Paenibacillus sp. L3-i20]|nr:hypothetical protein L3i20_v212320 [Paenibacillus sp. L3-i20]